ncbi:MAG TPA: nickel-dependent hydrogenase large subunit, partial [Gaiellaceae bacterium]|nr:nickel-dependent hydrogenase large subunit [Gaiellaceae bacterium]
MSERRARTKTIRTDYLARVEGEGAMLVRMRDGVVTDVKLRIYEPPRFFEGFLRGRDFREAPDITARICGICPVAYQMSSCLAMESLAGVEVDGQLRALRRLLYCGEWIESHTLHVFMLHAPDFLGVPSAVELAKLNPALVETALRLKKIGNEVMRVVGGREVHPINVRVGGWYKAPTRAQLDALVPDLEWAKEAAREAVRVVAGLDFPELEQDYEFVALDAGGEYPIDRGARLVSTRGLDIPVSAFFEHVVEEHVQHSNALHARLLARGSYLVGPLARYALHRELLAPDALAAAEEVGLEPIV